MGGIFLLTRRSPFRVALVLAGALLALLLPGQPRAGPVTSTLTVYINGIGTVKGDGINCGEKGNDCTQTFPAGTVVTLTAIGGSRSVFSGWTGACGGSGDTCAVPMDDGSKSVTAVFGFVETVSVGKTGSGEGTIVSDPAGVECGNTCAWSYAGDTPVILTAIPKRGSVFVGWEGPCKGTDDCTVHMTYGTISVSARFEKKGGAGKGGDGKGSGGGGGTYTPPRPSGFAYSLGGAAQWTSLGRLLVIRFRSSRAASVLLHTYHGGRLYSSAGVTVNRGPATIRLPMPASAPAGTWVVTARLDDGRGHKTLLRWTLVLPR